MNCAIYLLQPLKENKFRIPKSRYDSVDSYLSMDFNNRPEYNDNPLPIDEGIYKRLRDHGAFALRHTRQCISI